jgi:hypothetical protein
MIAKRMSAALILSLLFLNLLPSNEASAETYTALSGIAERIQVRRALVFITPGGRSANEK